MGRVEGKVAFITGGAHGQGRCHALRLAEEGADIVVVDIDHDINAAVPYPMGRAEELQETAQAVEKLGRRCIARVADVRDFAALRSVVAEAVTELGHIDIVSINHGIISFQPFDEITEETWRDVVDVNLTGVWNTFRAVVPPMKEAQRGGSIVITSSVAGIRGQVPYVHYAATKHGVVGMAKSMANELAPWRIRVNTLHPTGVGLDYSGRGADSFMGTRSVEVVGPIAMTNPVFLAGAGNRLPDYRAPFEDSTPVGAVDPIDVSNALLFLGSDEARYITGVQLPVDAGNTVKP